MICLFAAVLCFVMLLVLQFGFDMDTKIGFIITSMAVVVVVFMLYMKFTEDSKDVKKTAKAINRIILLQNTVKIRYVNNKNLLDYLYTKYNTTSAKELLKVWNLYEEERELRDKNAENETLLSASQSELKKKLSKYHLHDVQTWVFNIIMLLFKEVLFNMVVVIQMLVMV